METLSLLGGTIGIGLLSGISLYLTVFVVGLSVNTGWLTLQPGLEPLQNLAQPWVWGMALVFYCFEFFADKIPWVDSFWDTIHTVVRPVGAMFLAVGTLGQTHPSFEVLGVLLSGGAAFASHTAKAGTRLLINSSPEPFTNIFVSLLEDGLVVAGTLFVVKYPLVALCVVISGLGLFIYVSPMVFRMIKAHAVFILGKIGGDVGFDEESPLPSLVPEEYRQALTKSLEPEEKIAWAVRCSTGKFPGVGRHVDGYLIGTTVRTKLYFAGKKHFGCFAREWGWGVGRQFDFYDGFLYDEFIFYNSEGIVVASTRFQKRYRQLTRRCQKELGRDFETLLDITIKETP